MQFVKQTDAIVMDIVKSFQIVSLLAHELDQYGIRGKTDQWITSFLHNRSQAVVVEESLLSPARVKSGVPQGSVLGPCHFLVCTNYQTL